MKNALYKIYCTFSTIVLNVQYNCTKRLVQLYAMLGIYYITCSFCLCFTFLLALHSVVLTNLLAEGGLVELAAPKKQEERHCCRSSIYMYIPIMFLHLALEITSPGPRYWDEKGCCLHGRDFQNRLYYHFQFPYLV